MLTALFLAQPSILLQKIFVPMTQKRPHDMGSVNGQCHAEEGSHLQSRAG